MAGMEFALMVKDWSVAQENEFLRHRIQGEGLQTRLLRRIVMWQGCCGRDRAVYNVLGSSHWAIRDDYATISKWLRRV